MQQEVEREMNGSQRKEKLLRTIRSQLSPHPPTHTHTHAHTLTHTLTHTHHSPLRFKVAIKKLKMSVSGVKTRPKGEG